MPDHSVKFTVPFRDLGRSDIEFKVYTKERRDRRLVGTLYISHGALEWRSRKKHKEGIVKLDWHDFDRYMLKKRDNK